MKPEMKSWKVEITDAAWNTPVGWQANYAWVQHYTFEARTERSSVTAAKRATGYDDLRWDLQWDDGETRCYRIRGCAIIVFITPSPRGVKS